MAKSTIRHPTMPLAGSAGPATAAPPGARTDTAAAALMAGQTSTGTGGSGPTEAEKAAASETTAAGVPPVAEQAAAMATVVAETGRSTAAGAAYEDVLGSAREAPGVGSGVVGAQVPGDILAERGGAAMPPAIATLVRDLVAEEVRRVLRDEMYAGGRLGSDNVGTYIQNATVDTLAVEDDHDLEIVSRIEGFRRGGVAHPTAPTPRRSRDFSPAQLDQLRHEPNLIVRPRRAGARF